MATPKSMPPSADSLSFLYNRIDYERTTVPERSRGLKLERMRRLLGLLGNPQDALRIIHIAGTKGKGSTAAMIAAALTASGFRTGLYTSPHLERIEERIAIDGAPVSREGFLGLIEAVRDAVTQLDQEAAAAPDSGGGPTFFEITTAMAFVHFAQQKTDAAVLEVGLGGRLDSTNVCQPLVSVITSISFDHMQQLGNTLSAIAGEKAGIIKPGVPVVTGVWQAEPFDKIQEVAAQHGSSLIAVRREFDFEYVPSATTVPTGSRRRPLPRLHYRERDSEYSLRDLELGMLGEHQAANAATALATLRQLTQRGWQIPEAAIRHAFANLHCPARIEVVGERPTTIIDTAHNVASAEALLQVLDETFPRSQARRVLIFAASRDKDLSGMLRQLVHGFDTIVLTKFSYNPRSVAVEDLAAIAAQAAAQTNDAARPVAQLMTQPDVPSAWRAARAATDDNDVIVVTGSFFLAAEIRPLIAR